MDWLQIFSNSLSSILSPATIGYALAALGLAVHFGYAGLLNMGIAGFMAIGAYGYAISSLSFGFPWWLAILVGLGASAIFALILGVPTLRLRGDYLAIVTIAAAEVVRLLFLTTAFDEYTGSADGLSGYQGSFRDANPIPDGIYGFGPWMYTANEWWVRIMGLVTLAIAVLVVWMLMRSPWGRVLKGIREDEDAVRALGKNAFAYKMQALVLGGVLAAAGGIVYALDRAASPGVYVTSLTFFVWTALLLGGAATVFGPLLGSLIFWVLQTFLSNFLPALVQAGVLPFMSQIQAGTLRFILVGVALMLLVIFMPQGILGNKKELTFVK
ncbi:branched-chain amino acid ABC transporter permease [Agromyces sp. CFH 90414]|uniref:Branched-chain amino acid ABC transporter permease n=1 Tax=Agromyces agglutinans TaxID=2662258 RepID=A0A6I2FKW3_9MICO|nr:branched-chain amino acid ABC transporter permease [Agromyces agglutinans]MRG61268.1 branched-chain amino acid ABC transporter permease [Agromyces agglutinans]